MAATAGEHFRVAASSAAPAPLPAGVLAAAPRGPSRDFQVAFRRTRSSEPRKASQRPKDWGGDLASKGLGCGLGWKKRDDHGSFY